MLMYLGNKHVTSAAKGIKLQAIEVPRVANAKHAEAKNTPALDLEVYDWSKMPLRRSYGFQYASPYMFKTADCGSAVSNLNVL